MAFEHVSGICLIYDENTSKLESTCYQTVLRFHISLKELFSNSFCLGLVETQDERSAVLVSAVTVTLEHVHSPKVL